MLNLWSSAVAAVASDVTVQPEKPHAEEAGSKKVWGGGGGGGGSLLDIPCREKSIISISSDP